MLCITLIFVAIVAENCALLKPSELASTILKHYLDTSCIRVVLGGINKAFHTGSTTVEKIVMKAATERTIPIKLERSERRPVYVADNANIEIRTKRILW